MNATKAIVRAAGEGEHRSFCGGGLMTFKATSEATGGAFLLFEDQVTGGKVTPLVARDWETARDCQFKISRLWKLFKEQYPSSLKGAMIMMGRPVGPTRSPLPTATEERKKFLRQQLEELNILQTEPHGW